MKILFLLLLVALRTEATGTCSINLIDDLLAANTPWESRSFITQVMGLRDLLLTGETKKKAVTKEQALKAAQWLKHHPIVSPSLDEKLGNQYLLRTTAPMFALQLYFNREGVPGELIRKLWVGKKAFLLIGAKKTGWWIFDSTLPSGFSGFSEWIALQKNTLDKDTVCHITSSTTMDHLGSSVDSVLAQQDNPKLKIYREVVEFDRNPLWVQRKNTELIDFYSNPLPPANLSPKEGRDALHSAEIDEILALFKSSLSGEQLEKQGLLGGTCHLQAFAATLVAVLKGLRIKLIKKIWAFGEFRYKEKLTWGFHVATLLPMNGQWVVVDPIFGKRSVKEWEKKLEALDPQNLRRIQVSDLTVFDASELPLVQDGYRNYRDQFMRPLMIFLKQQFRELQSKDWVEYLLKLFPALSPEFST